jgi:hypothetical protein
LEGQQNFAVYVCLVRTEFFKVEDMLKNYATVNQEVIGDMAEVVRIEQATDEELTVASEGAGTRLKRKLEDSFNDPTLKAQKMTTAMHAKKIGTVKMFEEVMQLVGHGCGICWVMGQSEVGVHEGHMCPCMNREEREGFKDLKWKMKYVKSGGKEAGQACYKCHINSLGHDALHARMEKGKENCKSKNLVVPVAYAVYMSAELKSAAMVELLGFGERRAWEGIGSYREWLVLKDKEYGTKAMAVLGWYIRRRKGGLV